MPEMTLDILEIPLSSDMLGAKDVSDAVAIGILPAFMNAAVERLALPGCDHLLPLASESIWRDIHIARSTEWHI